MIFEYNKLREFLSSIKELGTCMLFKDWQGEKVFLLRHDIDFDLQLAYNLAEIEHDIGIVSTYFVLTTCPTYNVMSANSRKLLRGIKDLGHEIALHFDPTLYGDQDLLTAVNKETEILSFAIGDDIKSISLHNPSVHGQYPLFEGYINAYDPKLFSDANYIADSCYGFRGKNPFEFIKNIEVGMVQVLLHPMHYSEGGDGYDKVIVNSCERFINEVHENFTANEVYRMQMREDLLSTFVNQLSK